MSPYRTAPPLVLSPRRTGLARAKRRAFRVYIAVLTWWRGPVTRYSYHQSSGYGFTQRQDAISRTIIGAADGLLVVATRLSL